MAAMIRSLSGATLLLLIAAGSPPQSTAPPDAAGPIRVDTLPVLRIPVGVDTPLGSPNQAAPLADRSVIYLNHFGRVLVRYDSTGRPKWQLEASPVGAVGFKSFFGIEQSTDGGFLVWDAMSSILTRFDQHGGRSRLMRAQKPPPTRVSGVISREPLEFQGRFADGRLLTTVRKLGYWQTGAYPESTAVYLVSDKGKLSRITKVLVAERYNHDADKEGFFGDLPFGRHGRIAVLGSDWYYTDGSSFTIEHHRMGSKSVTHISRPGQRIPLDQQTIAAWRNRTLRDTEARLRSAKAKTLAWMPYPDSLPAYSDLLSDHHQSLWAQHGTPPGEPEHWTVFSSTGHHIADVTLPADLRVLDIGSDALLGYHFKKDGSGELLVYRIERE